MWKLMCFLNTEAWKPIQVDPPPKKTTITTKQTVKTLKKCIIGPL